MLGLEDTQTHTHERTHAQKDSCRRSGAVPGARLLRRVVVVEVVVLVVFDLGALGLTLSLLPDWDSLRCR